METKKKIVEVNTLRALAILLIIAHHSFAIFQPKGWVASFPVPDFAPYAYASILLRNIGVPLFIFLSGYVFQYQYVSNKKELHVIPFLINKVKRLMIPCIVFGLLYMLIVSRNIKVFATDPLAILTLLNGVDHLWFLPMLLWCFVFICLLKNFYRKPFIILLVSLIMVPLSLILPEDWSISKALYHFSYFALGFYSMANKHFIQTKIAKPIIILITTVLFLLFFSAYFYTFYGDHQSGALMKLVSNGSHFVANMLGIGMLYFTMILAADREWNANKMIINISMASFGMYLIQEFILKLILQSNVLFNTINIYVLPFVLFATAVTLSYLLTKILIRIPFFKKMLA